MVGGEWRGVSEYGASRELVVGVGDGYVVSGTYNTAIRVCICTGWWVVGRGCLYVYVRVGDTFVESTLELLTSVQRHYS